MIKIKRDTKKKRIDLKYKLILGGLASVLIPFIISGTVIYLQLSDSLFELTKEKAIHIARNLSVSINKKLEEEIKLASSIAADPDIIKAAETGDYTTAQHEIESIYERIGKKYFTIFLADKNGIDRADALFKDQIGLNLSDRDYLIRAKAGEAGVAGPIVPRGTAWHGAPIIVVYAPIQYNHEFYGTVVLPFVVDYIGDILTQHHIERTGYSFLLNSEGIVLAHPRQEYILRAILDQPGTEELKQLMQAGKDGVLSYSFEGIKKIAVASRIELTGWTAVFTQNRDEVMAPVNEIIFSIFIIGIIFVAVTVFIIAMFSNRISSPIQKMLEILKEITRHSTEVIVQIGLDRKIIYLNPAFERITGRKAEDIIGTEPFLDISNTMSQKAIWDALESGKSWSGRVMHRTNKTDDATLDVMLVPLRDEQGAIQSYLKIGRDITAELMFEKRLLQGQKLEAIGTLAGGIAHDFNNVLSAIFGYAELSIMRKKCDPETEKYINQIKVASERARDLISQILTFSRNTDVELRPLMPESVLKEVVKLMRASIPAKIEIESKLNCNAVIMAEPTQLHQIVMNLFTNATHAIGEKEGKITLELEDVFLGEEFAGKYPDISEGKHVRIRVSDTGDGIEPHILERIFEPFFTTKSQGQGTGLGLSVVHGIVKKLNGIITVNSESGKGTVFTIFIPCTETGGSMPDQQEPLFRQGSERIVIVDDERPITMTLQAILIDQGYKITAYTDSSKALTAIKEKPNEVDVIISDYSMPKLSGLDLVERLHAAGIDIPVILMSGFFGSNVENVAQRLGIKELIAKPINSYQITDAIRRIVDEPGCEPDGADGRLSSLSPLN